MPDGERELWSFQSGSERMARAFVTYEASSAGLGKRGIAEFLPGWAFPPPIPPNKANALLVGGADNVV